MPSTLLDATHKARTEELRRICGLLRDRAEQNSLVTESRLQQAIYRYLALEDDLYAKEEPQIGYFQALVSSELTQDSGGISPITSPHEGYALLIEKIENYWNEVKCSSPQDRRMLSELVQLAAIALRIAVDLRLTPEFSDKPTNPLTA